MIHRTEPYTIIAEQRSLIEDLAKSNEGYIRKFKRLRLSCEEAPIDQESVPADSSSSMPTPKTPTAHGLASALAVDARGQRESSADAKGLGREPYKGSNIPRFSSSDRLGWLLQQYSNLMHTLLREVSAPNYEIAEESRSRIRADIVSTQRREMNSLSQVDYPGSPSLANPMPRHHPITTGSRVREYSKVDMDQVNAPISTPQHAMSQSAPNSPSSAMSISFIAPSSNRVDETHAATQPQTPEAQSWTPDEAQSRTPENDDPRPQSYIRHSEASQRFAPPVLHSRTVPPAQVPSFHLKTSTLLNYERIPESLFGRDNSARQSDKLQPTQPESEGGVTPWQQHGGDHRRSDYNDDQVATFSSGGYGDFDEAVGYKLVEPISLSDVQHRSSVPSPTLNSEAHTSKICSEQSSSPQTRKRRSISSSLQPGISLGGQQGEDSSSPRYYQGLPIFKTNFQACSAPATANELPPALQSGEGYVIDRGNPCQGSRTNSATKHSIGRSGTKHNRKRIFEDDGSEDWAGKRIFEDDGSEDWAEHIVDKLLARWTTLPLHRS